MRRAGLALLAFACLAAVLAPFVAPHDPARSFADRIFAPPMRPHVIDDQGRWHAPFVYAVRLVDRLEQRFEEDRRVRIPLHWFARGRLVSADHPVHGPWLPLGADRLGRDVLSRLLFGARASLGVALVSCLAALVLGAILGGIAGYAGGFADEALMRTSELVIVLPTIYVVLTLRAMMPLVLSASTVFLLMAGIFALVGWPHVARGVRAIVAGERGRDYVLAAVAAGAGRSRVLFRHLLPATRGYVGTQATLLLPAFILAEATLSFVGLGFPDTIPSWGTMLHDASNVAALAQFPWTLSPAAAIFVVVLAANLAVQGGLKAQGRRSRRIPAGDALKLV